MQVTHDQLKRMLLKSFKCDIPYMVYGSPGIGKSDVIRNASESYAKSKDLKFVDWNRLDNERRSSAVRSNDLSQCLFFIDMRLSQKDPSDLTGIPFVKDDHMKWFPPTVLKLLSKDTCNAILFFDELTDASLPVMKSAYQLVLDRCCGELSFSKEVRVVAAGNRSEDRCSVNETPKALDNRFFNVELIAPDVKDWTKWAMSHEVDERIISFINYSPDKLCANINEIQEKSFPTPRSITALSKVIKDEDDFNFVSLLAQSACGTGFGIEFGAYLENAKDIDPARIIKNPKSFNDLLLGAKWFSLGALCSHYKTHGSTILSGLIDVMLIMDPDLSFVLWGMCNNANKLFSSQMQKHSNGKEFYNEFYKYLVDTD